MLKRAAGPWQWLRCAGVHATRISASLWSQPSAISDGAACVTCQVLAVEPNRTLSYTWGAYGLKSVVTWTLTPTSTGTQLRMEQSGFRPDQQQAYQGAKGGWQQFFAALEQVLARIH